MKTRANSSQKSDIYGLYSWTPVLTEEESSALISLAKKASVAEIYQFYSVRDLQDLSSATALEVCSSAGLSVWYLTGNPEWGLDESGTEIRNAVAALALYNASVPETARFVGIQLDVEPYLADLWDTDKAQVMELWYKSLREGKLLAEKYGIRVMICLPRWLDAVDAEILEAMLRDCCDEVSFMNYDRRDEAAGIAAEMALAQEYGRPIVCISELSEPNRHDLTDENTYYNAGLSALYASWDALRQAYPDNDLRFAYHYAEPLRALLETAT